MEGEYILGQRKERTGRGGRRRVGKWKWKWKSSVGFETGVELTEQAWGGRDKAVSVRLKRQGQEGRVINVHATIR